MKVEQIYTGCLAEAAYYIESNGEVAIIDPLRETAPYLAKSAEAGAKIKYVLETHFHADFVSGHVDLANKAGATIVYGPNATTTYDIHQAADNEEFKLGNVTIRVIHTPGHTMESTCYLLIDEDGNNHALFTGDTLFIGDVGRPDLAQKSDVTMEDLAGILYDSLREKVMTLNDDLLIYPAHGAGSSCGKNMSSQTWDTLGNQKASNYALRADMSKEEFVSEVTAGMLPPPQYFQKNAMINKSGYESLDVVMKRGKIALDAETFESMANHQGALVLDTRPKAAFLETHIPNSIFIGIDGGFAPWVGALITDIDQAIIFVADEGREEEVVLRLSRVGYDNTLGYLEGGIDEWVASGRATDSITSVTAEKVENRLAEEKVDVIDARKPGEFETEHMDGAISIPLDFINENSAKLDKENEKFVHCLSGYRSLIFISIMKGRGYHNLIDVEGGFNALKETALPIHDNSCASKN